MYAGQMRTHILIQRPMEGEDEAGQPLSGWTDVVRVPSDFRTLSGLESIKADAATATTRASARIRYREDIDTTMRVILRSSVYAITAVLPDENRRRYVDLSLEMVR